MALSVAFYQPASRFASSTPSAITGVAWSAGDKIVLVGVTNNVTVTLSGPTNANLTFGAADTEQSTGSSESNVYLWQTTAASSQTGQTININRSSGSGVFTGAVWVISGGPTGVANIVSNRTESGFSATVSAGSVVIVSCVDWNASAAGRTIATGSGTATERQDETDGTNYTIWSGDWVGTSAGTFTFGPTDYTGWKVAQAIIELLGAGGTAPAPEATPRRRDSFEPGNDWTPAGWYGYDLNVASWFDRELDTLGTAGPTYVVLVTLGLGATGTTSRDTATAASAPTGAASTATANSDRTGSATAAATGTSTAAAGHAPAITATAAAAASPTATAAPSPAVTVPAEIGAIAQATISAASDFAGASIAVAGVTAAATAGHDTASTALAPAGGTSTSTATPTRAATAAAPVATTAGTTAAAHSPAITSTAVAASTAQSTSGHSATVTAAASVGTGAAATVGAAIAATVTAAVGGTVTAVTAVARAIRTSVAAAVRALVRITIGEADAPGRLDVTIAPAATLAPTLAPAATLTVDLAPAAVLAPVLASAAVLDVDAAPAATLIPTIWPTGAP